MSQKILLIEDDKFLGALLVEHFQKSGLNFELAVDGEEGLEKIHTNTPDLIILDLVLPGIDGYEVLKRIKNDKNFSKIHVIILSNLGQKEEIERGLELGAKDFIVKAHFDLNRIVEKIDQVLKKKQ